MTTCCLTLCKQWNNDMLLYSLQAMKWRHVALLSASNEMTTCCFTLYGQWRHVALLSMRIFCRKKQKLRETVGRAKFVYMDSFLLSSSANKVSTKYKSREIIPLMVLLLSYLILLWQVVVHSLKLPSSAAGEAGQVKLVKTITIPGNTAAVRLV